MLTSTIEVAPELAPAADASRRRDRRERLLSIAAPLAVLLIALCSWELFVRWKHVPPYILPGPLLVLQTLWDKWGSLQMSLLFTVKLTLLALLLAIVGCVALGTTFVLLLYVEFSFYPYAVVLQVSPIIAIGPLIMIYVD